MSLKGRYGRSARFGEKYLSLLVHSPDFAVPRNQKPQLYVIYVGLKLGLSS